MPRLILCSLAACGDLVCGLLWFTPIILSEMICSKKHDNNIIIMHACNGDSQN